MLGIDCYDFYKLSVQVHPLTELPTDATLAQEWFKLYMAREELREFFGKYSLKTSRTPADTLVRLIGVAIPEEIGSLRVNDDNGMPIKLAFWHATQIKTAAGEFESVLKAELSSWDSYFVSQKAAYSTTELLREAERMVPVPGRERLSPLAVLDYRQAGTCLAFNMGTAASFHVVRATETVIKLYYQKLIGALPGVKLRNWGAYHRTLSKCPAADVKVLGWLRHLTEEYRNPVLHPEVTLSADEAIEFITACNALMTAIGRAMTMLEETDGNGDGADPATGRTLLESVGQGALSLEAGDAEAARGRSSAAQRTPAGDAPQGRSEAT